MSTLVRKDTPVERNAIAALRAIADSHYGPLGKAFLDSLGDANATVTVAMLAAMLAQGPNVAANELLQRWQQLGQPAFEAAWQRESLAMIREGAAVGRTVVETRIAVPLRLRLAGVFAQVNTAALTFAESLIATRIVAITDTTRDGIRAIVSRAFAEGRALNQTARALVDIIGFTPQQAEQWMNFRAGLEAAGVSAGRQARLLRARATRLHRFRAEVIARSETQVASHTGQLAMWQGAQAHGLLPPSLRRFWIVARDERTCAVCRAVPGLNAQGRGMNEPFALPGGGAVLVPHAHPHCRCGQVLREEGSV